jgi:hypothetical protein
MMLFGWGRGTSESLDAGETEDAPYELAAIELLTMDGRFTGWIATEGDRTSDWLNKHAQVPLHGLVDGAGADAGTPSPGATDAAAASPSPLDRERLIWVVPPPLPPNRHLRLHRRRVLVHIELDDFEISGQAHVRPGADAIDQVLRGPRDMVPLTDVQIVSRRDPGEGTDLPVLIVNRRHVRRVVIDAPHVSAGVPEPETHAADGASLDPRVALLKAEAAEPAAAHAERDTLPAQPVAPAASVAEAPAPSEVSGVELLTSALTLLLEAGLIDVVEFQSIRARISSETASHAPDQRLPPAAGFR